MFMAGKFSELECVVSGEVSLGEVRAHVFGSPVNPDAVELGTFDQVSIAVHTSAVTWKCHFCCTKSKHASCSSSSTTGMLKSNSCLFMLRPVRTEVLGIVSKRGYVNLIMYATSATDFGTRCISATGLIRCVD